jgi:transcriptional regulator with XRE-family HTH domain
MTHAMSLTINIRQMRKDHGLTLEELAAKIGVSAPHLSEVERGKKNLNNHLISRLAEALGVEPAALIASNDQAAHDHLRRILDQLSPDDRLRVEAFADALLRSQEASAQKE